MPTRILRTDITEAIDRLRVEAGARLDQSRRSELGQFMTAGQIARLMGGMFECVPAEVRIIDPGAGVGSLFSSYVHQLCQAKNRPASIHVTAYEIDATLSAYLSQTVAICRKECERSGIRFEAEVINGDFLAIMADNLGHELRRPCRYNRAILNPPYRKINAQSEERQLLRLVGIETTNLYTGFLSLAMRLLEPEGQLVAITPRSFCNGSCFRPFRQEFLADMELKRIHVFESRKHAFKEDDVLQENIIFHAIKRDTARPRSSVVLETSAGDCEPTITRTVPYNRVLIPKDSQHFIHIAPDEGDDTVASTISSLPNTLADLGLKVSTGRVVDFRAKEYLRQEPCKGAAPLIWPAHFDEGYIAWPKEGSKKPQAIAIDDRIADQLLPNEHFVIVKRFSAKEERRRVVAAVYDPSRVKARVVGFENHLNYFHRDGRGVDAQIAKGLAAYLNSTLVDVYFRQFNGHTQVNATDLKSLRYPSADQLREMGAEIGDEFPGQERTDSLVGKAIKVAG